MLEKTIESPLDCKEIQPVHPKGDQSWVFIGRTDAEANEERIHRAWTPSEACPCCSCSAASPVDSELPA